MSMNFGREQALLRQRLTAIATPERADALRAELGTTANVIGAEPAAVATAASDLAAQFPAMGRAQMTAFVRTLWQSKTHELRHAGVELLALREVLLEPADLPFLENLLKDADADPLAERLAGGVLGPLVGRNKKLWKDLQKHAGGSTRLQRAAVRAAVEPVRSEPTLFERFAKMAAPLCALDDAVLQRAIDAALTALADCAPTEVAAFAEAHGRKLKLPKAKATNAKAAKPKEPPAPMATSPAATSPAAKAPAAKAPVARAPKVIATAPPPRKATKPAAKKAAKAPARKKDAAKPAKKKAAK